MRAYYLLALALLGGIVAHHPDYPEDDDLQIWYDDYDNPVPADTPRARPCDPTNQTFRIVFLVDGSGNPGAIDTAIRLTSNLAAQLGIDNRTSTQTRIFIGAISKDLVMWESYITQRTDVEPAYEGLKKLLGNRPSGILDHQTSVETFVNDARSRLESDESGWAILLPGKLDVNGQAGISGAVSLLEDRGYRVFGINPVNNTLPSVGAAVTKMLMEAMGDVHVALAYNSPVGNLLINAICSGNHISVLRLNAAEGSFASPNYPRNYADSHTQYYYISAPYGTKVTIECPRARIEDFVDVIEFFDYPVADPSKRSAIINYSTDPMTWNAKSSRVTVRFSTNEAVNGTGWMCNWTSK